jgi:hypothetical protein
MSYRRNTSRSGKNESSYSGKRSRASSWNWEKCDLKDLSTDKLFDLLLRYSDALKSEFRVTTFSAEETGNVESMFAEIKHVST